MRRGILRRMRRLFAWILTIGAPIVAGIKVVLDNTGRYQDAQWLSDRAGPVLEFIADQPGVWLYGSLAVLALIGLSLHVPPRAWAALLRLDSQPLKLEETIPTTLPAGEDAYTVWGVVVRNTGKKTIRNISVLFDGARGTGRATFSRMRMEQSSLRLVSERGVVFSLRPQEGAFVTLAKQYASTGGGFGLGPMEDGSVLRGVISYGSEEDNTFIKDCVIRIRVVAEDIDPYTRYLIVKSTEGLGSVHLTAQASRWNSFWHSLRRNTARKRQRKNRPG